MSLSNLIKSILNIQDDNISFPEEEYCQLIQKGNYLVKVFKGFLKSDYCTCPHCNSKNIVKNGLRHCKIKYIPIQNYNVELKLTIQRYICDEFKSVKNIDGAMSFVFADYHTKNIIDIVENRRLYSLTEYFLRFSLEARNSIKYICMDMYTPYISLVNSIFPAAKIVIDKFHIVNLVNRAFNQTRISIMNSIQDDSLKRKLKLFWKSLLKYYPDLCQVNYYCQSFKRKLSSKDKVDYLLEKIPELEINFNIYQDIIQTIKHNNFKRFEEIVKKYLANKEKISKKMIIALRTLKKYMKYIENMFESNITNGVIESLNNKIKSIKRTAFGYSNFSNFKKRILIQAGIISISA